MQANQPNETRQILEDSSLNTSASIYSKWNEKYGLDLMQSSSLMSFEGLSMAELIHLQQALTSALTKESRKYQ